MKKTIFAKMMCISMAVLMTLLPLTGYAYEGKDRLSLYVSAGSVNGDGSFDKPFGTIEEARDYIRALKNNGNYPKNGVTVNFREGDYSILSTVKFTEEDSGTADGAITYRAYMNENVRFVGGIAASLSDFKKVTDSKVLSMIQNETVRKALVQYDLYGAGVTREMLGEEAIRGVAVTGAIGKYYKDINTTGGARVYFNEEEMTIARWPNSGYAEIGEIISEGDLIRNYQDDKKGTADYIPLSEQKEYPLGYTFTIDENKAKLWVNENDLRIYAFPTYSWYDIGDKVKTIDVTESTLETQHSAVYAPVEGSPYYIYNALSEIDYPGEYYIDRETGILYFYSPASSGDCMISTCSGNIIDLDSTEYVNFKNITVTTGRGRGISGDSVSHIGIEGCTVSNVLKEGISLSGTDCHVTNSHIFNVGIHGILIGTTVNMSTLTPDNNYIENCWIHNWGRETATYSGAVRATGVGPRISNCKINDGPHLAIVSYANDFLIEYTDLSDVLKESADSGAIYTGKSWIQRGHVYKNNYIHDINSTENGEVFGVYLDDYFCGATVTSNIFENISSQGSDTAAFTGGGRDTTYTNNITINTNATYAQLTQWPRAQLEGEAAVEKWYNDLIQSWEHNTQAFGLKSDVYNEEIYAERYPHITDYDLSSVEGYKYSKDLKYSVFKNNVSINNAKDRLWRSASKEALVGDEALCKATNAEYYDSYTTSSDPGFVDYANKDYRLKADSSIYKEFPDFVAADWENIGLYTLRLKNKLAGSVAMKINSPISFANFKEDMIDVENPMVTPIIIEDTTMLPIRYVAEMLGGDVEWYPETSAAKITVNGKVLDISGDGVVTLDGTELDVPVKPTIVEERYVVPVRVISEAFNKAVDWYEDGVVIISDKQNVFNMDNYPETLMYGEINRRLTY